jgi:dynein heavy chain
MSYRIKVPSQDRPSTLPRYLPDKTDARLNDIDNEDAMNEQRQKIREMLASTREMASKGGTFNAATSTLSSNNVPGMSQAPERKDIYTLDKNVFETFVLPGRQQGPTVMKKKAADRGGKTTVRINVVDAGKDETPLPAAAPKNFLSAMLGHKPASRVDEEDISGQGSKEEPGAEHGTSGGGNARRDDADEVERIMSTIHNGEDAINFFARYGSETPLKFVNLVQFDDPKEFRPYDLVPVELPNHKIEHYVMSSAGITHMIPNQHSEIMPISTWMRQRLNFSILRNIPFYRYFLHRKMFNTWYENVRFQQFARQRKFISERLFITRKTSCQPILEVKKHLLDVINVKLLDLEMRTCEKDTFEEIQSAQATRASLQFEESMRRVINEVQAIIQEVNNMAGLVQDGGRTGGGFADEAEKNKSLVQMKEERRQLKILKARTKSEASSLPDFIRFVDYLCVETIVMLAIRTAKNFYEELLRTRKSGIFETTIRFLVNEEGGATFHTSFSPTCDEMKATLDRLMELIVIKVSGINRVSYLNSHSGSAGPNIQSIVRENKEFIRISKLIQDQVVMDFERSEDHVQAFESLRPIYEFNATWDYAAFRKQKHDMSHLRGMMEMVSDWSKELDKLRNKPIGILEIDSKRIKGELHPLREARLNELKDYVKDTAKNRCIKLLEHYKRCISDVQARPSHLKDFAGHCKTISDLRANEKADYKDASTVDQMYTLLQSYDVVIPPEHLVLHEDLHDRQAEYRREIDAASSYREAQMESQRAATDANVNKMLEQVALLSAQLDEPRIQGTEFFDDPSVITEELATLMTKMTGLENQSETLGAYQKLFDADVRDNTEIETAQIKLKEAIFLWDVVKDWTQKNRRYTNTEFRSLDVEEVDKEIAALFKQAFALHKKQPSKVTEMLKDQVADFKALTPSILDLGNPNMRNRHWAKIFSMIAQPYFNDMPFTLNLLIQHGIMSFKDMIGEVSGTASGESQLEDSLSAIKKGWSTSNFNVLNHRDTHGLYILGSLEEIFVQLEDNQVTLQTMLGSRFIATIREEVEEWSKKLAILSETLDEWMICQKNWMYLENIFGAEDIQKQLPAESQKFLIVDRSWKLIMTRTNNDPLVVNSLDPLEEREVTITLLQQFLMNNAALESIQKSLEEYLETKRMAFPRFYFLSNDELLEILSQTRDPHAVQPFMAKCFDAIKRIKFGEGPTATEISGFTDPAGEVVPLTEATKAEGAVEFWLLAFEKGMRGALYDMCKAANVGYPAERDGKINRREWLWTYPAQVVIAIDQVQWTYDCQAALVAMETGENPAASQEFLDFSLEQIDAMVDLVRTDLTKLQRTLMGALLTIDVHARDVTRAIVRKKVGHTSEFEWTKQLRYYWDAELDDVVARQTNTKFQYGYEYLGNGPRLVITPLTDLCYMTLTGALHMRLGGAPAGPAGTGKTETTKDLAKALAVYCVVFNCSDGLDYKIMGRFFKGLAQQGAWSCFDEFNRIDIEVLSVIAQQILCIQQAIKSNQKEFDFEGSVIPINYAFGVFITMNPGYAGRTELPDNLKALFRPVAMMVPDYRLIAEIILFSEGFANALPLSNKMSQLYALSSEQLSKQAHYDFGMRAVKSVLVAAGQLKRKEPDENEDILLIRAMRDSNVPKFLEQDLPLFGGILKDLFPGIVVPFVDYGKLQVAIETTLDSLNLQQVPTFITKVIQVHETQLVRHGMMVVGEAGSGKTTNLKVLSMALAKLYEEQVVDKDGFYKIVDRLILNPKSIAAGELYGNFNLMTNEWSDGIVPKLVRECVTALNEGSENRKWIIFDGPVDAVWIENMNTVLDDNKTLCLANSERIKLPGTLHMLFEVQDLKVASPATVSRCGMVFMEQVHVGMLSLVRSWASTTLKELASVAGAKALVADIESNLGPCLEFIRYNCTEKVATSDNQLTQMLLNLIAACLKGEADSKQATRDPEAMSGLLVWCITWSLGGNLHDSTRSVFVDFIQTHFKSYIAATSKYRPLVEEPYNYFLKLTSGEVSSWKSATPRYQYDPTVPFFSILVPTEDTVKYRSLLQTLTAAEYNVLFMAETGVGKSVIISSMLDDAVNAGTHVSYTMGYSAQTKPANLRDVMETKLEKKRKNLLGPPSGKQMLLFVDDLNMPALETYGAQPPNELLRQIIDGGFYDVNKLFYKNVKDLVCIAACAPPGGGRNDVTPRLLRQFHMLWLTSLSTEVMSGIFTGILRGFMLLSVPTIASLSSSVVDSSINIYTRIQNELLPTPLKSHYTFNLRDLSKIFSGIVMVRSKHIDTKEKFLQLWTHESARVFRDRLINTEDREWFDDAVLGQLHEKLDQESWNKEDFNTLAFADLLGKGTDKEYHLLEDMHKVHETLVESLEEYNITFPSTMDLVFFSDAIGHICRISRVLSSPRGNAVLVGVGGSGRQSLTRIAAFIADMKLKQIEITRGYGKNEWHDNLKEILMLAGAENKPTVFLFSDTQIVMESFLEDINNVLNSGEVPNLYAPDELDQIFQKCRLLAKAAGKLESRESVLQHYVSLVRDNLHIVLAMSPIGSGFRNRCRMFPSIVNCCTIDWFDAWPEEALYSVAERQLNQQTELGISEFVPALSNLCNVIHRTVETETETYYAELKRFNYTTPTSYLELIKLYISVLKEQQGVISANERRYRIGLDKLAECEEIVAKLEVKITEMQPVLEQSSKDAAELLIKVTADQQEADKQQAIVEVDVAEANKVAAEVKIIKDDCEADLAEAMPAYESAVKALATLDKKSIQEMKAFNNPPALVKFTLEAVCILMDQKPDWGEAKKLMSQMDFMDQLKSYDKDNIPKKTISKVKKYFDDPQFQPETVKSQSSAAMCLCMWVRAMVVYDKVAKGIEPKKAKLAKAESELAEVMAELDKKQAALKDVLDRVAALQRTLKETQDKLKELEASKDLATTQLERAGKLLGGLGGEKIRWKESAKELNASLTNLVGDMCLAAACLAYLGPFTSQFRAKIVSQWVKSCRDKNIPCSEFSLLKCLADPVVVRKWQIDGLPADDFSCENGLMATRGRRWPLMIDPQGQANRWVRNTYASKNLQIIKLTEKDYLRTLENGIRYGAPVLLENVAEELDPSLEPVLLKQTFKKGGQILLRLGDTDVPYSDEFAFMITTKLANPHYMPEICIKVTVINFTVTMKGLEDQLLVDVIKNERPDLEEKKDKLVVSIANDQSQLRDIEEQILSMLASASGDILDDEELINALEKSKVTSNAIKVRLDEAEKTTQMINDTREGYRVVATRGSVIYFVVASLALVDPMYQYSLQYYKALIQLRLQKTEKKKDLQERLDLLIEDITRSAYNNICRGLFEKDKVLFSFLIAAKIAVRAGKVPDEMWQLYMVGPTPNTSLAAEFPIPDAVAAAGVTEKAWNIMASLEFESDRFVPLRADVEEDPGAWAALLVSDSPHLDELPGRWRAKLSAFERLVLVRSLREEKNLAAVGVYVSSVIGASFTESPPFDLEGAYSDSTNVSPLIFILSPGADPTDYILQLAESKGKRSALKIISLGQGQGPIAEKAIDLGNKVGDWVCLQNCHLAVSWLARLEQLVERMQNDPKEVDAGFRLWLTAMPSKAFPVPVLQNGIKITNEPPRGLRANLTRTFLDISPDEFEACSKPGPYKKLAFAVAFFNGIILERRKFGAVGWNIAYQWMNSDLKAAMAQVRMYVEDQDEVPWETLNVIVSAVTYGGRVTDDKDKRTISAILSRYVCPDLLREGYTFTQDEKYFSPPPGSLQDVLDYVRQLPQEDNPDCFGLHANAAITFQQKESKAILFSLALTSGGGGGGGGGPDAANDGRVSTLARAVADRMPEKFDPRNAHVDTFAKIGDSVNSLGVFLNQELMRFNGMMDVMRSSLKDLQKAIRGEVVMSGELEEMYMCFVFQRTPPRWEEAGYPCLKPLPAWVEDFFARLDSGHDWLVNGPQISYWLSGFFFPQGFMTAVKQTYSRREQIAVDTLQIGSELTNFHSKADIAVKPEHGAYVHGLFMEAARFDTDSMQMQDSYPRILFDAIPAILLKPVVSAEYNPQSVFNCPLYKTSLRAGTLSTTGHSTNFVVMLQVPSPYSEEHWIRRGTAMLCMLDE